MRRLLHRRVPTPAIDSYSVGKPNTTLMGTSMRIARLQASRTEPLITKNHRVVATEGNCICHVVHDKPNNLRTQPVHHRTTRKSKVARHLHKGTVSLTPLPVQLDWPMSSGSRHFPTIHPSQEAFCLVSVWFQTNVRI